MDKKYKPTKYVEKQMRPGESREECLERLKREYHPLTPEEVEAQRRALEYMA